MLFPTPLISQSIYWMCLHSDRRNANVTLSGGMSYHMPQGQALRAHDMHAG